MKIGKKPPLHLTYCLNVHPGETWDENFDAIRTVTLEIRNRVAPKGPFGLGLRLGHTAADQLANSDALHQFKTFNVLPEHLRQKTLMESVAEEYAWVLNRLSI